MSTFSKKKLDKEKREAKVPELEQFLLQPASPSEASVPDEQRVLLLPPSQFYVDEQVRKTIDPHEIELRAASMRKVGQIQPIVVYPQETTGEQQGKYKIDKGECRWRAAQLIEGFELKAIIDVDAPKREKHKRIIGQISENEQRANLLPLELAQALNELLEEGMTQEDIALELGWITKAKKPNFNKVSRILSIMKLPPEGKSLIEDQIVTDFITLEFLRKIFEINATKFFTLCRLARDENGITRKRAEQEYKHCKADNSTDTVTLEASDKGDNSRQPKLSHERVKTETTSNNKTTTSEQKPFSTTELTLPVMTVLWQEARQGILLFDRKPESPAHIWLQCHDTDEIISVALIDLRIIRVSYLIR